MANTLKKIMVVEDDPDIQLITRLGLEICGSYDVLVCASGAEAVQAAQDYAPQLILLDMMMPGMDGFATLSALRGLPGLVTTPVIFLTANVHEQLRQDMLKRGALGVIFKPIEPQALVDQIHAFWQRFTASS